MAPAGTCCAPAAGARIGPERGVSPEEAVTWQWLAEILLNDVPRPGAGLRPSRRARPGGSWWTRRVSLRALTLPAYGERIIGSGARSSKAIKRGRRRCGVAAGHG